MHRAWAAGLLAVVLAGCAGPPSFSGGVGSSDAVTVPGLHGAVAGQADSERDDLFADGTDPPQYLEMVAWQQEETWIRLWDIDERHMVQVIGDPGFERDGERVAWFFSHGDHEVPAGSDWTRDCGQGRCVDFAYPEPAPLEPYLEAAEPVELFYHTPGTRASHAGAWQFQHSVPTQQVTRSPRPGVAVDVEVDALDRAEFSVHGDEPPVSATGKLAAARAVVADLGVGTEPLRIEHFR